MRSLIFVSAVLTLFGCAARQAAPPKAPPPVAEALTPLQPDPAPPASQPAPDNEMALTVPGLPGWTEVEEAGAAMHLVNQDLKADLIVSPMWTNASVEETAAMNAAGIKSKGAQVSQIMSDGSRAVFSFTFGPGKASGMFAVRRVEGRQGVMLAFFAMCPFENLPALARDFAKIEAGAKL